MEKILLFLLTLVLIFVAAVFGGTLLYWLWPHVIPTFFPTLVENGHLPIAPIWKHCVGFAWICGILFRPTINNKINKED